MISYDSETFPAEFPLPQTSWAPPERPGRDAPSRVALLLAPDFVGATTPYQEVRRPPPPTQRLPSPRFYLIGRRNDDRIVDQNAGSYLPSNTSTALLRIAAERGTRDHNSDFSNCNRTTLDADAPLVMFAAGDGCWHTRMKSGCAWADVAQ